MTSLVVCAIPAMPDRQTERQSRQGARHCHTFGLSCSCQNPTVPLGWLVQKFLLHAPSPPTREHDRLVYHLCQPETPSGRRKSRWATGAWPPGYAIALRHPSETVPRRVGCAPSSRRPSPSPDDRIAGWTRAPRAGLERGCLCLIICVSVHHRLVDGRRLRSLPCGTASIGLERWAGATAIGRLVGGDGCAAGCGEPPVSVHPIPGAGRRHGTCGRGRVRRRSAAAGPARETWGRRAARTLQSRADSGTVRSCPSTVMGDRQLTIR